MPRTPSLKALWEKHREDFIRFYAMELVKKIGARDLEHCYTDLNNTAYFRFPKDMALPVERLGKLYYFSELLFKGLSPEEDEKIDAKISDALEVGLKNSKHKSAAMIGSLLMERQKRREFVFHTELLFNLLAVQWVREDENPSTYSNEIQMQKVVQFKKEVEEVGAYPFFQVEELKQLRSFFDLSKEDWEGYWKESLLRQQTLKEALAKVYTFVSDSKASKMTSPAPA